MMSSLLSVFDTNLGGSLEPEKSYTCLDWRYLKRCTRAVYLQHGVTTIRQHKGTLANWAEVRADTGTFIPPQ